MITTNFILPRVGFFFGNIKTANVDEMNEKTSEVAEFTSFMVVSLKNSISVRDKSILDAIEKHIKFLQQDMSTDVNGFASQTKF